MLKQTYVARAIEPLLITARGMDWPSRRAYLNDLRRDAPTLIAEVERVLAQASARGTPTIDATRPLGFLRICAQYLLRNAARNANQRLTWRT